MASYSKAAYMYVKEVAFDPGYPHGPLEQEGKAAGHGAVKNPSQ
jgi:hypothetical protein